MNIVMNKEYTKPRMFNLFLLKDEFTPMEFVIDILEKFFYMDRKKATDVMLEVHQQGQALCGVFAKDFGEAKVSQVVDYARNYQHPLTCSLRAAV